MIISSSKSKSVWFKTTYFFFLFISLLIKSYNSLSDPVKNSSGFELEDLPNIKVEALKVDGQKCQRCWKYEDHLINDEICKRCHEAIN